MSEFSNRSRFASVRRFPLRGEALELRCLLASGYGGDFVLYADGALQNPGLTGSYVNQSLRGVNQVDWRPSQAISGTRIDPVLFFPSDSLGIRSEVGITSGSDANWDNFSVQWDGYVSVENDIVLALRSDDGSRMWIDLDQNGNFAANELFNNGWGNGQAATIGGETPPLAAGTYPIRIQYEEGNGGNTFALLANPIEPLTATPQHMVRVAYVVPHDRTAQPEAIAALQEFMPRMQHWYREQMDRWEFGPLTFQYELEDDGISPQIHQLHVGTTSDAIRQDTWGNTLTSASGAGLPTWAAGQVWLLIPESHLQLPSGAIQGGTALGASNASGSVAGVAMVGSDSLFKLTDKRLRDGRSYAGTVIDEIGPYPLVQDVSFQWFAGTTFSSLASSSQGAIAHELGHAFGLPHDFRNDSNFNGNVMGNGLRGFRGAVYPDDYLQDEMRLAYRAALALSTSRYFNSSNIFTDNNRPTISISTSGAVTPLNGLLQINFTANDNIQLASAHLQRGGEAIGEMRLQGTSVSHTFATAYYTPGTAETFQIAVYDTSGNRQATSVQITPSTGLNRGPIPYISVSRSQVMAGGSVTLDASRSSDPNHSTSSLTVEWDLNGDGVFDTSPSTTKTFVHSSVSPGNVNISARLTDPLGASTIAAPLAIRIVAPAPPAVVYLFYNNSTFDGYDPSPNAADEMAIAFDKQPLRRMFPARPRNVTTYIHGINGVILDFVPDPLRPPLTVADFVFRIGNQDNTALWQPASPPSIVATQLGAGALGRDRVELIWPDGEIVGTWLEIRTKAGVRSRLPADDVFYFGSQIGDVSGDGVTNATDFGAVRANPATFLNPASVSDLFDIDRDARVNAADLLLVRDFVTQLGGGLMMITPSGALTGLWTKEQSQTIDAFQDNTPISNHERLSDYWQRRKSIAPEEHDSRFAKDVDLAVLGEYAGAPISENRNGSPLLPPPLAESAELPLTADAVLAMLDW